MLKKIRKIILDIKQNKINKEYSKNGYSEDLFEKQIKLNEKRNKFNLKEKDYVQ